MAFEIKQKRKIGKIAFPEYLRRFVGLKRRERQVGTLVEFGKGEMDFGVITRLEPTGVWVQPLQPSEDIGLEPRGKEIFIEQERFERHLGEEGAVSPMLFIEL